MKNVDQCFPEPKVTSSNVLFCPQPKEEKEKERREFGQFFLQNDLKRLIDYQNSW